MKNKKIHISYEPESDVLSMSRDKTNTIDHAEEMGDVVLHVNTKNEPVLVEILNASRILRQNMCPTRNVRGNQLDTHKVIPTVRRKSVLA